jgi:hypothetical protein
LDLESEGREIRIFGPEQQGHMTKNSLTLAVAFAALASLSAKAQIIAYDNTTGYQGTVTSRGNVEIGDEINLTTGASTLTDFQFEYNYVGADPAASGVLRFYAKDGDAGALQDVLPGTLLFESASFTLQTGFHQGAVNNLSLAVPGTFIWTVQFSGISGSGDNAGLLFYNGVGVGGGPGQSFDDHWEFVGEVTNPTPHWVLTDNAGLIDNFGARVTVVPEPTTVGLLIGGAAVLGLAIRRRKA